MNKQQNWEKKFDEQFDDLGNFLVSKYGTHIHCSVIKKFIKSFIKNLLKTQRERCKREKCETAKANHDFYKLKVTKIVQEEIAQEDKYTIAPLQRIMIKLIQDE